MSSTEIEIPPAFEHLAMVRSVLANALEAEGALKQERLQDLRLAVSEGTTNAIESHQAAGTDAPVRIGVAVEATQVTVSIADQGGGFDPAKLKPHPPVTDPERLQYERGLGITLMRTLADRCDIETGPTGTTVTLTMNR